MSQSDVLGRVGQALQLLRQGFDQRLAELGLRKEDGWSAEFARYFARVAGILAVEGSASVKRLAEEYRGTNPTYILQKMAKLGLIEGSHQSRDARVNLTRLTEQGAKTYQAMVPILREFECVFGWVLTDEEVRTLRERVTTSLRPVH